MTHENPHTSHAANRPGKWLQTGIFKHEGYIPIKRSTMSAFVFSTTHVNPERPLLPCAEHAKPAHNLRGQGAFSLLELAIALAIIAVLSAGFIKGRELWMSSRSQAVIDQLNAIEIAVTAFESRYLSLPGDFANPSGTVQGAGNGDGSINTPAEAGQVFTHLASAGFIKGSFTPINLADGSICPRSSCPSNPFGGTLSLRNTNGRAAASNAETPALELRTGNQIPSRQLAEIDRKIDDGNPLTGSFRAVSGSTCINSNGWIESTEQRNCEGIYVLN